MRVVVAGTGFGAQHLDWLAACPDAAIVGVYAHRDTDRLRSTAARHGAAAASADLPAFLRDVAADALVVATPPATHAALLHVALQAGLHAISDKPLAADIADARQLAEAAAARTPGKDAVTFQWRSHPGIVHIRDGIASAAIGAISHVELRFHHDFLAGRETPWPWRHRVGDAGAGALGDQGVHLFDLLRFVSGAEWQVASAIGQRSWPTRTHRGETIACETEDVADVVLRCAAAPTLAFVHVSRVATGLRSLAVRVFGTEGTLDLQVDPDTASGTFRHLGPDGGDGAVEAERRDYVAPSLNPYPALIRRARGGDPRMVADFADGLAAQRLVEASVTLMRRHTLEEILP